MATRLIPVENVARLVSELEKLAKRAAKIGCEPPTWALGAEVAKDVTDADGKQHLVAFREVTVEGKSPKFEGWHLGAVLEPLEDSEFNLVRTVPDEPEGLVALYKSAPIECEHCKANRRRTETFVCCHDDGRKVQVGRQCLADFLGHASPDALAKAASLLALLGELCDAAEGGEGGGWGRGGTLCADLGSYLEMVACSIRRNGWCSRAEARDSGRYATANQALDALFPTSAQLSHWQVFPETRPVVTAEDTVLAEKAAAWALAVDATGSDFLENVRTIAEAGIVTAKAAGVAAAIIPSYCREVEKELKKKAAAASVHFGTVGKREVFELTLIAVIPCETQYGTSHLCKFLDAAGNVGKWFASNKPDFEIGETWKIKATVKEHGDWKGAKETSLSRCALVSKVEKAA